MKWKIGNVTIENKLVLAPMAGVCNSAFRRILKECGVGLIYAEMVSDKAICYRNKKTVDMLYMTEGERPITQQIFGSDIESFTSAAKYIEEVMKPDIIDINMGCPVPKVALKNQAGSALLKDPDKVYNIVKSVVDAVSVPVTVKIRSGWDHSSINAPIIAKKCEEAGASAICIHGRTRSQGYSGTVDLDVIKMVKEAVNIPVIGNGDIKTKEDAIRMLEYTKCDAIMIGRAFLHNPFFAKELLSIFDNTIDYNVSDVDKINLCLKHINYLIEFKEGTYAATIMRGHIPWYLKGLKNGAEIKNKIYSTKDINDIIKTLEEYRDTL